ncbi:hypothetical protein XENOCAPTIV_011538 [Xenoophorus captivus]|uniref:Uncharacterized protein n=1 Tax=Xenoophorus captivus TaxID=1517983 RepID=A0ABV0Q9K5_9TELE
MSPLMGFSGVKQTLAVFTPLHTMVGKQKLLHSFVVLPDTPVSLLSRDILIALGATILCSMDGLVLTFPDGTILHAVDGPGSHQYVLCPEEEEESYVDIYQGFIEPETPSGAGVRSSFLIWKPWLRAWLLPAQNLLCHV